MGSSHGAMAKPAVSEPSGVQHRAHLHFTPEGEATLQVPELELFLDQEGVSFSDRSTWDVLRFVYQIGGLSLTQDTLKIIRERRSKATRNEPPPDYEQPSSILRDKSRSLHVSPVRKRRSGQQRPPSTSDSSNTTLEERKDSNMTARPREVEKYTSVPNSPTRLIQPLHHKSHEDDKEIDDGWSTARSSADPSTELPFGRPVSKVWKRPMTSEVHEDLVRALKERSRENIDADVVEHTEQSENSSSMSSLDEKPQS